MGIGGVQCCIYSVESPGGFWVLGRTPVRLYDPTAPDPILLRAGDRVRFRPIDRAEYDAIAAVVAARPLPAPDLDRVMSDPAIQDAGPLTTVQDLGPPGQLRVRHPAVGADGPRGLRPRQPPGRQSGRRRRARVHADRPAAASSPTTALVAVTGADMPVTVNGAAVPALGDDRACARATC